VYNNNDTFERNDDRDIFKPIDVRGLKMRRPPFRTVRTVGGVVRGNGGGGDEQRTSGDNAARRQSLLLL